MRVREDTHVARHRSWCVDVARGGMNFTHGEMHITRRSARMAACTSTSTGAAVRMRAPPPSVDPEVSVDCALMFVRVRVWVIVRVLMLMLVHARLGMEHIRRE